MSASGESRRSGTGPGRRALAALGLVVGAQLLMGDAIAPGCCTSNDCEGNPAVDMTFEVSGDCSEPGTIQVSSGAHYCQLTVTGHPAWPKGYRGPGVDLRAGGWNLSLDTGGAYRDQCLVVRTSATELRVDCDRLDGGACSSVLRPVP